MLSVNMIETMIEKKSFKLKRTVRGAMADLNYWYEEKKCTKDNYKYLMSCLENLLKEAKNG